MPRYEQMVCIDIEFTVEKYQVSLAPADINDRLNRTFNNAGCSLIKPSTTADYDTPTASYKKNTTQLLTVDCRPDGERLHKSIIYTNESSPTTLHRGFVIGLIMEIPVCAKLKRYIKRRNHVRYPIKLKNRWLSIDSLTLFTRREVTQ
jgi:hypothetical protein